MNRSKASYNSRTKEKHSFQIKESKHALSEEQAEERVEEPVVGCGPHTSLKNDIDDELEEDPDEDPEEDPETELEEDSELDPEEDLDEESNVGSDEELTEEPSACISPVPFYWDHDGTKQPVEDASKEIASEFSSQRDAVGTDNKSGSYHDSSKEKKRPLDATVCNSDTIQVHQLQKKFRQEELFKEESDGGSSVSDPHGKAVVSTILEDETADKQLEHAGSSGKRSRSRWDQQPEQVEESGAARQTGKRRKTRWVSDLSQLKMLGPIQLPDFFKRSLESGLDHQIQKLMERLHQINSKLRSSELHDERPEEERSPSPQPEYNNLGIRINTREVRLRNKLVKERQIIISKLIKKNSTFNTPPGYKPEKLFKKLYVPVKEYPEYNFIGYIIGPRGNTLKRMEKKTGAKILLRGRGSQRKSVRPEDDEDLHVYIEALNQKSLDAAVGMVEKMLIPVDGMSDRKRAQLQELAKLNGTYKGENYCNVCKEEGHKQYVCPQQPQSTFKMMTACSTCGSFCHPAFGCPLMASPQDANVLCHSSELGAGSIPKARSKLNKESHDASLYVGYLPQDFDDGRLRELFCPFGKIIDVKVIKDFSSGLSKGYGFVNFESPTDAAMAVTHMNGRKMEGKILAVRVAGRPPPPQTGLPALSHFPVHPGPPVFSTCLTNQTAWPGPFGSAQPEPQGSFPRISEGFSMPSSIPFGHDNHLLEGQAIGIPPLVSCHASLKPPTASNSASSHGASSSTTSASHCLPSQFPGDPDYPGSQFLPYFATPTRRPSPQFHISQTSEFPQTIFDQNRRGSTFYLPR
ncbi:splicing factor-like protein 1 [Diospyros lotus]|uniref:splicing factor-like protein 1 n=1 Tax=Diospyros lotus TaxID=55363 RepID=UPI0022536993|nr:splicing factor-like protein 1 [Diospyros lotus]XP_052203964.1 splicing factor-like protein 1 [Diospyros lotus]